MSCPDSGYTLPPAIAVTAQLEQELAWGVSEYPGVMYWIRVSSEHIDEFHVHLVDSLKYDRVKPLSVDVRLPVLDWVGDMDVRPVSGSHHLPHSSRAHRQSSIYIHQPLDVFLHQMTHQHTCEPPVGPDDAGVGYAKPVCDAEYRVLVGARFSH